MFKLVCIPRLDPSPICDHQNIESSSIVCPFYHAGTMALDFEWLTSENASFCEEFGTRIELKVEVVLHAIKYY